MATEDLTFVWSLFVVDRRALFVDASYTLFREGSLVSMVVNIQDDVLGSGDISKEWNKSEGCVCQLCMNACISLTMGYLIDVVRRAKHLQNTHVGIYCCSRTCKASPTASLDSSGMLHTMGIRFLKSNVQSVSNNTPKFLGTLSGI